MDFHALIPNLGSKLFDYSWFSRYLIGGYGDHNFFDLDDHVIEEILVHHSPEISSKFLSHYHSKHQRSFINSEGKSVAICDYSSASNALDSDTLRDNEQELNLNTLSELSNPEYSFNALPPPSNTRN